MQNRIKVFIVDDSAFARFSISRQLQSDPGIELIGSARDGVEALEKIPELKPDVVTLDVEMPRMDGLTTLERIMSTCPTPVVMLSTLTGKGAQTTIKALELGAIDFFLKSSPANPTGTHGDADNLIVKLKAAASARLFKLGRAVNQKKVLLKPTQYKRSKPIPATRVAVIGSSTGGPRALYQLIPSLPADIPAAVLVVQHMPPGFTRSLAERLNELSEITVMEANAGCALRLGEVIIAPGGYHMIVKRNGTIGLNQDPPVCGVRPSVDITMESAVAVFGNYCVGVVLTGMGSDGTNGTSSIKAAGGRVIAEDESTCSIYGMPRSVVEAGNADYIVPLPKIASELVRALNDKEKHNKP